MTLYYGLSTQSTRLFISKTGLFLDRDRILLGLIFQFLKIICNVNKIDCTSELRRDTRL